MVEHTFYRGKDFPVKYIKEKEGIAKCALTETI
jgi:hypothetical protein